METLSHELDNALLTAEAAQIQKIDGVMHMLEKLRVETLEEFQKCKEEEAVKRKTRESAALSLEPSLNCLDCFIQHLTQEVDEETTKAIEVHTEKLEKLQQEQMRLVEANDSPQKNPLFAKEPLGPDERHKCLKCPDYDLCAGCYNRCQEVHPEH